MASAAACVNNSNSNNPSLPWMSASKCGSDVDFEFCLVEDGVGGSTGMLPADQLFSNGKLLPLLHRSPPREEPPKAKAPAASSSSNSNSNSNSNSGGSWKHLLRLKKRLCHSSSSTSNNNSNSNGHIKMMMSNKSLRHFLPTSCRASKCAPSNSDSLLNLPLLKESDSSSRQDLNVVEDVLLLPRLSLDSSSERLISRPNMNLRVKATNSNSSSTTPTPSAVGGVLLVESPRMNSSGKIVFHFHTSLLLGRSSSSPSSFPVNANNAPTTTNNPYNIQRSYSSNKYHHHLPLSSSLFPFRPLFSTAAATRPLPHHQQRHTHTTPNPSHSN